MGGGAERPSVSEGPPATAPTPAPRADGDPAPPRPELAHRRTLRRVVMDSSVPAGMQVDADGWPREFADHAPAIQRRKPDDLRHEDWSPREHTKSRKRARLFTPHERVAPFGSADRLLLLESPVLGVEARPTCSVTGEPIFWKMKNPYSVVQSKAWTRRSNEIERLNHSCLQQDSRIECGISAAGVPSKASLAFVCTSGTFRISPSSSTGLPTWMPKIRRPKGTP